MMNNRNPGEMVRSLIIPRDSTKKRLWRDLLPLPWHYRSTCRSQEGNGTSHGVHFENSQVEKLNEEEKRRKEGKKKSPQEKLMNHSALCFPMDSTRGWIQPQNW